MQECVYLGHIGDIGCCAVDVVHYTAVCVDSNVRFHHIPLLAFLGVMHLWIMLPYTILRRTRCSDQGCMDHPPTQAQPLGGKMGIDLGKQLLCQTMAL